MKKSATFQIALWAAPAVLAAVAAGVGAASLRGAPGAATGLGGLFVALGFVVFAVRRAVVVPMTRFISDIAELRRGTGKLPATLPLKRVDEIGQLARGLALLAGDRNASELRRLEVEAKLAALTDATPDAIFRVDRDGTILDHQAPQEEPFFVDAEATIGKKLTEVFPDEVVERSAQAIATIFANEANAQIFDFQLPFAGEDRKYQARFARSGANEVLAIIRDRTRLEKTVSSRARFNAILDNTQDPVVTMTPGGEIQYMNPAFRTLLEVAREGEDDKSHRILDFLPEWTEKHIFSTAIPTVIEEGVWQGETSLVTANGVELPVALTAVTHRADNGAVDLISFIARDQSERKRFDDQLSFLADHDPQTSLYTRRRFVEELGREIARAQRTGAGGAVVLLDLDGLKYVNDSVGHRNGDRLLTSLAQVLKRAVRTNDLLARLDGDEFAVLVAETQPSRVDFIVERLLKAIRNHSVQAGEQPIGTTASAGVALFPEHGNTVEQLLARADQALDLAKHRGRDQFALFKPDDQWKARVDNRLAGEKLIREALARGRFVLHAQPILDLKTGEVAQYEILIRMLGDNNELVPPLSFLPTAERFGLIRSLDRWVVRQSILLLGSQKKLGNHLKLSVNLSGKSLGDFELTTTIEQALRENGVEPGQLTLEITETAAITDLERAKIFAIALKQIGCRLALDDFGVGFSSMSHVKQLPVDYLKIDGSFIRDLPQNAVDQHLVRAMVEIARGLKKRTVAEFVGSEETMDLLRQAGVDYAQGFYVGKPEAVENFLPSPSAA